MNEMVKQVFILRDEVCRSRRVVVRAEERCHSLLLLKVHGHERDRRGRHEYIRIYEEKNSSTPYLGTAIAGRCRTPARFELQHTVCTVPARHLRALVSRAVIYRNDLEIPMSS